MPVNLKRLTLKQLDDLARQIEAHKPERYSSQVALPIYVAVAIWLIASTGCATATERIHCFSRAEWDAIKTEKAPCSLPELSDSNVLQAARSEMGPAFFDDAKLGPRPYRIRSVDCHYEVEFVVLAFDNSWAGFDAIDGTSFMLVGRDGRTSSMRACVPSTPH